MSLSTNTTLTIREYHNNMMTGAIGAVANNVALITLRRGDNHKASPEGL